MPDFAIRAEKLSKSYQIRHAGAGYTYKTLQESLLSLPRRILGRKETVETFWALKDVSFEIKQGERLGIIGRNGAGKSTLLKLLSKITEPTSGQAIINGRVASLLEVGTGFHPELTGRENIFMNGAILGMSRAEIRKKFDEIVAFAEVEKFLDTPVKRYSSGMYVRLAFAVAAHLEPEILLVDEVLAVGDAQFQKKCLSKMGDVSQEEGRTILFVSHNMGAIRQLCPRTIRLHSGGIKEIGASVNVTENYLSETLTKVNLAYFKAPLDSAKPFQLLSACLKNKNGEITQAFSCDEPINIEITCDLREKTPGLYGALEIYKADETCILFSDSRDIHTDLIESLAPGMHTMRMVIPERSLGWGEYFVYISFASLFAAKQFSVDSPGIIFSFRLDDLKTIRGNRRPGHLSLLLPWTIDDKEI